MNCWLIVALLTVLGWGAAQAQSTSDSNSVNNSASTGFCDRNRQTTAGEQDHIFRFAAAVRDALDASGGETVIISRSGLDLSRFKLRYSHAAIMARNEARSWTARQLYYACDEGHPRIFDQGLAGFAAGSDNPSLGYISIVVMPADAAKTVQVAAQEKSLALGVLGTTYSANSYPFSTLYQNCNQWVMELLAVAWGNLPGSDHVRTRAQDWLKEAHYDPEPVHIDSGLLIIATLFTPMLHLNDHPRDEIKTMRLTVSVPSTVEAFVRERLPASQHIELCHTEQHIVVHHGWTAIAEGCVPGEGDQLISLQ